MPCCTNSGPRKLSTIDHRYVSCSVDAANTDRLVSDGTEGLVCDRNDGAGIARALKRFFALGKEERRAMGEAGHLHATARFAVSRMAERTMDVYERVLSERAPELGRPSRPHHRAEWN